MWEAPLVARQPASSPLEAALRAEAIAWAVAREADGTGEIGYQELAAVTLASGSIRLKNPMRGIWRPAGWRSALSIVTAFRREGADRPYEDAPGPDGLWRYKWMGDNPASADNVALRNAMASGSPLVWFVGVASGRYIAVAPVWIVAEEPEHQQFVLAVNESQRLTGAPGAALPGHDRRWVQTESLRRVHQPLFRRDVLTAYASHCAVCKIAHTPLLDAAHIIPDTKPNGDAVVTNGMALCKIHHAAYDSNIIGVTPDYRVEVRADILDEQDGPMLEHGLKELHRRELLWIPRSRAQRPDQDRLRERFEEFLQAS
jgi:putative restriction endonuclease